MPERAAPIRRRDSRFRSGSHIQLPCCHDTKPDGCHDTQDLAQERRHKLELQHLQKSSVITEMWCGIKPVRQSVLEYMFVCVSLSLYPHSVIARPHRPAGLMDMLPDVALVEPDEVLKGVCVCIRNVNCESHSHMQSA